MSNNNLWHRLFGRSNKRRTSNSMDRFSEQFDTRLNFRELEPRMVLSGTAMSNELGGVLDLVVDLDEGHQAVISAFEDDITIEIKDQADMAVSSKTFNGISDLKSITLIENDLSDAVGNDLITTKVTIDSSLYNDDLEGMDNLTLDFFEDRGIESTSIQASFSVTNDFSILSPIGNKEGVEIDQDAIISVGGDLVIDNQGFGAIDYDQSQKITIAGDLKIVSSNGATDIALNNTANDLATVSASGSSNTITISDQNSLLLSDVNANTLNVTTDADNSGDDGGITQTVNSKVVVSGTTTFVAGVGDDVILSETGNDFHIISAIGGSPAGAVIISDVNDIILGIIDATTLTVIADSDNMMDDGTITQDGVTTITVSGSSDFTSGKAKAVVLKNQNDFSGPISVAGQLMTESGLVEITDINDVALGDITAASLVVLADGAITDETTADIIVSGAAAFNGTSILIDGDAGTMTDFGTLNFNSAGDVTIQEDSDTLLTGINTADNLTIHSTGSITDTAGTKIDVTNAAEFKGTSITLGDDGADMTDFGTLNFNSAGDVQISEDSNTLLTGINTAD
ncbi:MAG: hypothetical protein ACKVH8_22430, partial [Pirellulales bacterium]